VHTPSKSPSTARVPGTESSAATSGISVVPGLAKQMSTPAASEVSIRTSAPVRPPDRFACQTVVPCVMESSVHYAHQRCV